MSTCNSTHSRLSQPGHATQRNSPWWKEPVCRFILAILFGWLLLDALRAQDTPFPLMRIAFSSCADEEKPQPIWDAVVAYQPQLLLLAGDNVYGDVPHGRDVPDAGLIESLLESYAQAAQVSGMAQLRSTMPHPATWDSHERPPRHRPTSRQGGSQRA